MQAVDPRTLDHLIRTHGPALVLYSRQFCNSPEDAVQDAFIQLMSQANEPEQVLPWLFRTVRNRSLNLSRSASRRQRHEQSLGSDRQTWFDDRVEQAMDAESAVQALKRLDRDQRETVIARIWGGLSFDQIAELTETSTSTAFRRYERGLVELRAELEPSSSQH